MSTWPSMPEKELTAEIKDGETSSPGDTDWVQASSHG